MITTIEIRPTGAALGADVLGADLAGPSADTLERIRTALRDNLVLRLRGTALDDAGYIAFGRTFGEIEPPEAHTRTASMTAPEFPEMSVISNVLENGVARGEAGDGELKWHTDHGFMERPAGFTMLLAREVPASGGDTSFLNMYRAYQELRDELRARVQGRSVKHQASHSSTGQSFRRPTSVPMSVSISSLARTISRLGSPGSPRMKRWAGCAGGGGWSRSTSTRPRKMARPARPRR